MAEAEKSNGSNDVVTFYSVTSTARTVTFSPPCLKLETWLRMTKIPFKAIYGWNPSKKGKMPWIEYKGEPVADSNFCIEFLNKEFGVDIDEHLTAEERAVSRAFQVMLEENTYWTVVDQVFFTDHAYKIRDEIMSSVPAPIRYILFWKKQSHSKDYMNGHGIGRHTNEEIHQISERDLRAVSTHLGQKKFLFGDKPCVTDASLFGIVAFFLWECPESRQHQLIKEHLPNLAAHAERIKETYFPDWDKVIEDNRK